MADSMDMGEAVSPAMPADIAPPLSNEQYTKIAQAMATLLFPTITAAVDRALAAGITQLRKELGDHTKWLSELEHCLYDLEDEVQNTQTSDQQYAHRFSAGDLHHEHTTCIEDCGRHV